MRCIRIALLAVLAVSPSVRAETVSLDYYLPGGVAYDANVPAPASVLGYEVGEYHVRHDQLVAYFRALADASPRVRIERYGLTHERRELLLATITSPENHARLDAIRDAHVAALEGAEADPERPLVVWLGYSVHGDESSGANASLLAAYHFAAASGERVDELLRRVVILIDPCINPDGLSRFAQWANSHRGKNLVADPSHREHVQGWPTGRTNHYWFDLNRDWLLLTHPESRARLERFHAWMPNVLADHHEMGTSATFFFQPGVPTRQNPVTPPRNLELTRRIAAFHARALDEIGSLYYTEERFDDFYFGKGSTYPDVHGAVGILFEQASSRGHVQESPSGPLSFPFTIRNQLRTSLSTVEAALELRAELLAYQVEFYASAPRVAAEDPVRAWVFGGSGDAAREHRFLDILSRHRIHVHRLNDVVREGSDEFAAGSGYIVPAAQPQYRLAKALFERRSEFEDPVFYDVSAWTLPLAFALPFAELRGDAYRPELVGEAVETPEPPRGAVHGGRDAYAHVFEWKSADAPRALARLLDAGVRARVATRPFEAETSSGRRAFGYGTVIVPRGIQPPELLSSGRLRRLLGTIASDDGIDVHAVASGLTARGIDLGSPNVVELALPRPLLVVGPGVSTYEAGEVWHELDQRVDLKVSMVEAGRLDGAELERYTHVIFVSGGYGDIGADTVRRLHEWVRGGGVVVATNGGCEWVERELLETDRERDGASDGEAKADKGPDKPPSRRAYADYERLRAETLVSGSIFATQLDVTHPLGFGFTRSALPVFRTSTRLLAPEDDPFATAAAYTDEPLLAGYASEANRAKIAGSPAVCARRVGGGCVIRIADNPNFRGVWYGTRKLFLNALFFGSVIKSTGAVASQ